ncbi:Cell wall-associated polypeptide CWBP200 [Anaerohalosphaera lusitana]|uniref:Cell wall-associated polypeptide CWBP200 n=1 Tax=Anaerohalosphaera lusitana TaxID=1936003 RepID=A0A1U9NJ24_9BACT|nr:RHS repeat-associated core domain-containing protein [Anaerohalosphaera lusitana]AQT67724.1 Cell wall-associated polypeptide CWBP200 [Anaerohalosphaera lusitana]
MEFDNSGSLTRSYVHANAQVLSQDDYTQADPVTGEPNRYYYIHDRLGSVRIVYHPAMAEPINSYTYDPYGQDFASECSPIVYPNQQTQYNPFKFTGQWHDSEFNHYYLRARMYDPFMARFTTRDPVFGKADECLTLHKYLFSLNDPVNNLDPSGKSAINIMAGLEAAATVYATGLTIATVGADLGNLDLIIAGGYVQQLSGLAFAWGYATAGAGDKVVRVSRWGKPGLGKGDWVMKGKANYLNWIFSGKLQPGMTNQFASYKTAQEFLVNSSDLVWPSGFFGFMKGLLGQRRYMP